MIALDNFESCVPYRILVRGEEYYEIGAVSELEEDSPGEWTATVEGTENYSVEISMDGKEIESWYCDCPYDGEICKHVVATLLAIRDNEKKVNRSAFSKMKVEVEEAVVINETVDIQQLLSFVNPQELSQFIYEYASMHPEFKTALLTRFMAKELSATSKEKDYRAEIQKVFNDSYYNKKSRYHNRYDDFDCDWETVFNRMDTFLEKADFFLNVGNIDTAIDIALQTLRSIGENYEDEYDAMGKERSKMEVPQMPPNKMFLISGNNTGTGILQNIMDSEGTGLIFESEADTLSTAIGSEHGHWSDTLRKAFDHDFLSYNRRGNQEYRETKKVCLSLLMSGTPLQVKAFIPTTEDGGSSRQLYYYMYGIDKWVSQFVDDETDWEEVFNALGLEWKNQLDVIREHGIHTLQLTSGQKNEIDAVFSELFDRSSIANDREMYSFVARMAINLCRIMSEVAVLRALEHPNPYSLQISSSSPFTPDNSIPSDNRKDGIITRWNVSISAEDFHAVLNLAEPLYCHAMHILSFLPNTEVSHRPNADRDFLFQQLGKEFTRTELLEKATALGINKSTAITWLKRLTRQGKLISVDGKGAYARACVYE